MVLCNRGARWYYQTVPLYMRIGPVFLDVKASLRVKLEVFCYYFPQWLLKQPVHTETVSSREDHLHGGGNFCSWSYLCVPNWHSGVPIALFQHKQTKEWGRWFLFIASPLNGTGGSYEKLKRKELNSPFPSGPVFFLKLALVLAFYYNIRTAVSMTPVLLLKWGK